MDSNINIMVKGLFPIDNSNLLQFNIFPHPNLDPNLGVYARYNIYNFESDFISNMTEKVHYIFNYLSTQNSKDLVII